LKGAVAQVARISSGGEKKKMMMRKKVGSREGRRNWADSVAPTTDYYSWTTAAESAAADDQQLARAQVFVHACFQFQFASSFEKPSCMRLLYLLEAIKSAAAIRFYFTFIILADFHAESH